MKQSQAAMLGKQLYQEYREVEHKNQQQHTCPWGRKSWGIICIFCFKAVAVHAFNELCIYAIVRVHLMIWRKLIK